MKYTFLNKCICCVAFIVINISVAICQQLPATPCPAIFTYLLDGNEIVGFITVNSTSVGQPLLLSAAFSIRGPLYSTNQGSLELAVTEEQAYQRALHNKPLQYKIKFPAGIPVPTLNEIYYNNDIICAGNPVQADVVSIFKLNHNLTNEETIQCGIISKRFQTTTDIERGSWPWLAALYKMRAGSAQYQCGGNLLSPKAVITAAHCFLGSLYGDIEINKYSIQLGRFDLDNLDESGYISEKLNAIHIHEDYEPGISHDSNIAIAVLEKPVRYTEYIRPICLWEAEIDQKYIVGRTGITVAWSRDESDNFPPKPRRMEQPVGSEVMCLRSNIHFYPLTSSNKSICAGGQKIIGPCAGSSGSGLAFLEDDRWVLRGTVSGALAIADTCAYFSYVVYSDIAQFLPWIQKFL